MNGLSAEEVEQHATELLSALPGPRTLRTWMHALWTVRLEGLPMVPDACLLALSRTLSFDFTYKVGSGVWVSVPSEDPLVNKKVLRQLVFLLGAMQSLANVVQYAPHLKS